MFFGIKAADRDVPVGGAGGVRSDRNRGDLLLDIRIDIPSSLIYGIGLTHAEIPSVIESAKRPYDLNKLEDRLNLIKYVGGAYYFNAFSPVKTPLVCKFNRATLPLYIDYRPE